MKTFTQLVTEDRQKERHHVLTVSNMNPPSFDHFKLIDKVHSITEKYDGDHTVLLTTLQDSKRNPLNPVQKKMYLEHFCPTTNFDISSLNEKLNQLHQECVTHLHIVGDKSTIEKIVSEIDQYQFEAIIPHITASYDADEASMMCEYARTNNNTDFRSNIPIDLSDEFISDMIAQIQEGMGINTERNRGINKAIFVTGGPGSGKDIIIRNCIAENKAVEFSFIQAQSYLIADKGVKKGYDIRTEAIKHHYPLVINGPADDFEKVSLIKEKLESIGYETMMVFVDTTDNISKERNSRLSKMMIESVRHEKWEKAHQNNQIYSEMFDVYMRFDNNRHVQNESTDITEAYILVNGFLDTNKYANKINKFLRVFEEKLNAKSIQKTNISKKKMLRDNNSPVMQYRAKIGHIDDVRDGDAKINSNYIYNRYSESSEPVMIKGKEQKVSNFQKDADTVRKKKYGDRSLKDSRVGNANGIGSTFDTRGSTPAAGAGMGDLTYREETSRGGTQDFNNDDVVNYAAQPSSVKPNPLREKKALKKFKEAIDSPGSSDMGVGGTLGGSTNKEPMVTPMDKYGMSGITIKKKKTGAK